MYLNYYWYTIITNNTIISEIFVFIILDNQIGMVEYYFHTNIPETNQTLFYN